MNEQQVILFSHTDSAAASIEPSLLAQIESWFYRRHNSRNRLGALLSLWDDMTVCDEYALLRLLGSIWESCDLFYPYAEELEYFLGSLNWPALPMMTPEETACYSALPEEITIYRGCSKRFRKGFSWSMDPAVAGKFPFLSRHAVADPVLVTARVRKGDIIAVKLGRGEQEIVTLDARITKTVALKAGT